MTRLSKITLFALLSFFVVLSVNAQKFGYINSAQLLVDMPEIKAADSQIESFQQGLVTRGAYFLDNLVHRFFPQPFNSGKAEANRLSLEFGVYCGLQY